MTELGEQMGSTVMPVPVDDYCSSGCMNLSDWGNTSSVMTERASAKAVRCAPAARGPGQNGACPQPTYLSTPGSSGGNSSQAYLLGQLQNLAQCGGFVQTTGTLASYSSLQIPVPLPCSLAGTQRGKYNTSESRFQMYNRRQNPVVCPPMTTAQINSTMPQAQAQRYCLNITGVIQ